MFFEEQVAGNDGRNALLPFHLIPINPQLIHRVIVSTGETPPRMMCRCDQSWVVGGPPAGREAIFLR